VSVEVIIFSILGALFFFGGILLILFGFFDKGRKRKIKFVCGFSLLISLPVLGLFSEHFQERDYENDITGNFFIEGKSTIILKLNPNKTFLLFSGQKCLKQAHGTWSVKLLDEPQLVLYIGNEPRGFEIRYKIEKDHNNKSNLFPFDDNFDVLVKN
jgi:hypothetical protein